MNRTIITISLAAAALAVTAAASYAFVKRTKKTTSPDPVTPVETPAVVEPTTTAAAPAEANIEHYFDSAFADAAGTIDFKEEYHNGTGYFNGMSTIVLGRNAVVRTTDNNGRKIIIIGSGADDKLNNVVVFQRYTDQYKIIVQMGSHNLSVSAQELADIFAAEDKYAAASALLFPAG